MRKRSRRGAEKGPGSPAADRGDSGHAVGGLARLDALDLARPGRESDRGGAGLDRDPYQDEGGEG